MINANTFSYLNTKVKHYKLKGPYLQKKYEKQSSVPHIFSIKYKLTYLETNCTNLN